MVSHPPLLFLLPPPPPHRPRYVALHAWLLVYPKDLCADWAGGSVDLVDSVFDVRLLGVVTLYAVLLFLLYEGLLSYASSRFRGELLIALALLVAPFIPATGLFMEVHQVLTTICMHFFNLVYLSCEEIYTNSRSFVRMCPSAY